jgi:hypothetical protein
VTPRDPQRDPPHDPVTHLTNPLKQASRTPHARSRAAQPTPHPLFREGVRVSVRSEQLDIFDEVDLQKALEEGFDGWVEVFGAPTSDDDGDEAA